MRELRRASVSYGDALGTAAVDSWHGSELGQFAVDNGVPGDAVVVGWRFNLPEPMTGSAAKKRCASDFYYFERESIGQAEAKSIVELGALHSERTRFLYKSCSVRSSAEFRKYVKRLEIMVLARGIYDQELPFDVNEK